MYDRVQNLVRTSKELAKALSNIARKIKADLPKKLSVV
jgi:hypothetical protein